MHSVIYKRTIFYVCLIFSVLACTSYHSYGYRNDGRVRGNGNIIRVKRDNLDGFSRINVSMTINVKVRQGDHYEVIVETDQNLQDHIGTKVEGDELRIFVARSFKRCSKMVVYVTLPKLEGAKASSCGSIKGEGLFKVDTFYAEASSAGDVSLELNTRRVDSRVSSGGDVKLSGTTGELYVASSSGGDFHGVSLQAVVAKVRASSGGSIKVNVKKAFIGRASSGGDVYYYGNPSNVDVQTSSGGDITKRSL